MFICCYFIFISLRRAYHQAWYQKNKQRIQLQKQEYLRNNVEKRKETVRRYYLANKEKILAYRKQHYEAHKELRAKQRKAWAEKHKAILDLSYMRYKDRLREKVFHILGHICVRCGEYDKRVLQFDHINSDDKEDKRRFSDIYQTYRYYSKHPEEAKQKLQVMCAKCNWIKRYENSELN